ncbi:TrkA C-terminal domain-containing protein [Natronorubrum texcoconense]|uniref:TrkA-C domain-containing protein n=1 Tax=Natronorubrum texcoconense TaxID=1095776 RepID=A0A1G8YRT1_9EURY|nr:TrkA C-terminal domain-containing protein [Natronorubrum texcoconense]SDK05501.1 TrkA-C domain-containing protein [Natronorubrum texcoconense]
MSAAYVESVAALFVLAAVVPPFALDPVVAQTLPSETLIDAVVRILGFGLLAAGTGATVAFVFRWYSADEIPEGIAILLGVTMVAIWLNTQSALQDAIIGDTGLLEPATAVYTVAAFTASAIAADGGRRAGDYLARDVFAATAPRTMTEVGQLVRSAGRVVTVELPETIADVDGYDPVDPTTKAELAGQTFLFPRRLTTDRLRERLIDRLERDHGIGHVDVEFADDGTISHLGLGSRPAGIGPTLAPGSVAVAIRGDPAPDASPGDAVRIWRREGDSLRRVTGGELRGVADDVATVAVDADDAESLESDAAYRLVTLPRSPGAERDLVSLLRAADETVTTLPVAAGDGLAGATVGSLPVLVVAVERGESPADAADHLALPDAETQLEAGDTAYVLGRPEALRRVSEIAQTRESNTESAAAAGEPPAAESASPANRTRER